MPAFFLANMSEKFVETPIEPHSSRRDIADRINRAFSTSDITAICQRLRGVQPSVASSDDHKIALNVRSGSKTEVAALRRDVCFEAVNGLKSDIAPCPKSANNGSGTPHSITSWRGRAAMGTG